MGDYNVEISVWGLRRITPPYPCVSYEATKGKHSARGYSWATLSPVDITSEAWSSRLGVGRGANNPILQKQIVTRSEKATVGRTYLTPEGKEELEDLNWGGGI
jgi:hypothetical protein